MSPKIDSPLSSASSPTLRSVTVPCRVGVSLYSTWGSPRPFRDYYRLISLPLEDGAVSSLGQQQSRLDPVFATCECVLRPTLILKTD